MNKRSGTQRKPRAGVLGFLAGMQITLAAAAWSDLAVRPADEIRGSKRRWALIIAINFVGPIAYFTWGRRPMDPAGHPIETP
ncbi:PLD nuclease N-terminal domain-containing protein [Amycolatopsis alba]|uniref:Cardiolipin synthase N-terminal domain-containing protein n=1 Tax=Amycolatopsis alba DSM 44262 TaxID=1125972 RepID=A0A229RFH2_AMYAL|nr:PLD nuclease N-terminal domain-containing protein [Amycolatopsis alba]OXM45422.1 hypothetical protein CFP75_31230 [Amycolatopsis alba DSM 44262]